MSENNGNLNNQNNNNEGNDTKKRRFTTREEVKRLASYKVEDAPVEINLLKTTGKRTNMPIQPMIGLEDPEKYFDRHENMLVEQNDNQDESALSYSTITLNDSDSVATFISSKTDSDESDKKSNSPPKQNTIFPNDTQESNGSLSPPNVQNVNNLQSKPKVHDNNEEQNMEQVTSSEESTNSSKSRNNIQSKTKRTSQSPFKPPRRIDSPLTDGSKQKDDENNLLKTPQSKQFREPKTPGFSPIANERTMEDDSMINPNDNFFKENINSSPEEQINEIKIPQKPKQNMSPKRKIEDKEETVETVPTEKTDGLVNEERDDNVQNDFIPTTGFDEVGGLNGMDDDNLQYHPSNSYQSGEDSSNKESPRNEKEPPTKKVKRAGNEDMIQNNKAKQATKDTRNNRITEEEIEIEDNSQEIRNDRKKKENKKNNEIIQRQNQKPKPKQRQEEDENESDENNNFVTKNNRKPKERERFTPSISQTQTSQESDEERQRRERINRQKKKGVLVPIRDTEDYEEKRKYYEDEYETANESDFYALTQPTASLSSFNPTPTAPSASLRPGMYEDEADEGLKPPSKPIKYRTAKYKDRSTVNYSIYDETDDEVAKEIQDKTEAEDKDFTIEEDEEEENEEDIENVSTDVGFTQSESLERGGRTGLTSQNIVDGYLREKVTRPCDYFKNERPMPPEAKKLLKIRPQTPTPIVPAKRGSKTSKEDDLIEVYGGKFNVVGETGEEVEMGIGCTVNMYKTNAFHSHQDKKSGEWKMDEVDESEANLVVHNALSTPNFSSGLIILPPNGIKPSSNSKGYSEVYHCISGTVSIKIHDNDAVVLRRGGFFHIPPFNSYAMHNPNNKTPARLVFTFVDVFEENANDAATDGMDGEQ
ncbi:hypothetical protein ABK040_010055 [Willaertia magna]